MLNAYPPRRAVISWLLFDWATQPFFTLISTFIFAPFFATAIASNTIEGQALWGYAVGVAGLCTAIFSPILGSIADSLGPRKPWIAFFGMLLVIGSLMVWFAKPGETFAISLALIGFFIATIGAEFATIFNNAMMTRLVPHQRLGWLSGMGWAIGYVGGLLSLIATLAFFAADPTTGKTMIGIQPIWGLDATTREGDRLVGPLTAAWFLLFVLPMFLFTPDTPKIGISAKKAVLGSLFKFRLLLSELRQGTPIGRFLLANMIYQDGLAALFAFGGIYGAGVFGWKTIELGIFGVMLTVAGTVGALVGGWAENRVGGKNIVLGAIIILFLACIGIISLSPDHVLFLIPISSNLGAVGIFSSVSEKIYLLLGLLIGLVAGPMQAASRSLLAHMSPLDRQGEFFGLFALSGKVTSFVAPTLVALSTSLFNSQQAGLLVLMMFFMLGAILLNRVVV